MSVNSSDSASSKTIGQQIVDDIMSAAGTSAENEVQKPRDRVFQKKDLRLPVIHMKMSDVIALRFWKSYLYAKVHGFTKINIMSALLGAIVNQYIRMCLETIHNYLTKLFMLKLPPALFSNAKMLDAWVQNTHGRYKYTTKSGEYFEYGFTVSIPELSLFGVSDTDAAKIDRLLNAFDYAFENSWEKLKSKHESVVRDPNHLNYLLENDKGYAEAYNRCSEILTKLVKLIIIGILKRSGNKQNSFVDADDINKTNSIHIIANRYDKDGNRMKHIVHDKVDKSKEVEVFSTTNVYFTRVLGADWIAPKIFNNIFFDDFPKGPAKTVDAAEHDVDDAKVKDAPETQTEVPEENEAVNEASDRN